MRWHIPVIVGLSVAVAPVPAQADASFVMRTVSHDLEKMPNNEVTIWLTPKKAAFATTAGAACSTTVIYDADSKDLRIVDHKARVHVLFDAETIAGLADLAGSIDPAALEEAMKQAESMPPEYRAQIEEAIRAMQQMSAGNTAAATDFAITKTGEAKAIDGRPCVLWRLSADGERAGDAWLTELASVGVSDAEFASLKAMYAQLADVLDAAKSTGFPLPATGVEYIEKLPGFPVAMTRIDDGTVVSETKLVSITSERVAPSIFEVPKGYREEKLGG